MSGIQYEVLTGDALLSALRGGSCGDLLEDAADAAADEIERLQMLLAEAVGIVRDLTRQITEFTEREGEADFYTGVAVEFLKKQSPCNHVWARRLRGRETCAVCGVARRPTIDAHLARQP